MFRVSYAIVFFILATTFGSAAVLPPKFIDAVAAIGHKEANGRWVTDASGFFYGYLVADDPDPAKRQYRIFLVTNWHVIENRNVVSVRLNPKQAADQGRLPGTPLKVSDPRCS